MPSLDPLPPLEITVNIQPNAECITPLELGNIKYQYPVGQADLPYYVTTDKISEIVVAASPIPYSRFAATYGPEPSITMQRQNDAAETAVYSTQIKVSDFTASPEEYFFKKPPQREFDPRNLTDDQLQEKEGSIFNPGRFNTGPAPLGQFAAGVAFPIFDSVSVPKWANRDSSAYYPQVDFFPRYNQWFASTTWSTPFEESALTFPPKYAITFIYVNRTTKTVYYRDGFVKFNKLSPGTSAALSEYGEFLITRGTSSLKSNQGGNARVGVSINLSGTSRLRHPVLEQTVWKFQCVINGTPRGEEKLSSSNLIPVTSFTILREDIDLVDSAGFNVALRATSLDSNPVTVTSNEIFVRNNL